MLGQTTFPNLLHRSTVTLAALVARNQTLELPVYLNHALDSGVTPAEISELITHPAFYAGWGNAMGAVVSAKDVFAKRKIGLDQLPSAVVVPLPLDQAGESRRAAAVAQVPYHLNRATDIGLTQAQASEALTQLAFYAGWPNVFSAIPVAKSVFDQRAAASLTK